MMIVAALLASCAPAALLKQANENRVIRQAFSDACRIALYDCWNLPKSQKGAKISLPTLEYHPINEEYSSWGQYWGGTVLYLDVQFDITRVPKGLGYLVLAHEMTHYLQTARPKGDVPMDAWDSCEREAEAFFVGDAVADEIGKPEYKRPNWYRAYPQCNTPKYWDWEPSP